MAQTIRRNWHRRVSAIKAAARFCEAYDSDTGHMVSVDPARAFEAWERSNRATLSEETPAHKWAVHVHSNSFYYLYAEDPDAGKNMPAPAAPAPAPSGAWAEAERMSRAAGPIGQRTADSAQAILDRQLASGAVKRDSQTASVPGLAARIVAATVRDKRAAGLSDEEMRGLFEDKRAQAQAAEDLQRVKAVETFTAIHTEMMADEASEHARAQQPPVSEQPAILAGGPAQLTQQERRAAYRLHHDRDQGGPAVRPTEAERLDLARRGELASRPSTVEVYVSPITHRASVRFTDAEGRTHADSDVTALSGTSHTSPMANELLYAATELVMKRGFNFVKGSFWDLAPGKPDRARVAIVPTAAYLAYIERRFGPEPVIPDTPGVTFRRTQRGRWDATAPDGREYALTWTPALGGDWWRVWGGPQHTDLIRSTQRLEKALFVLKHPSHART